MIDVVIPFQNSINRDEELRYALRSLEAAFTNIGNIVIVGDTPNIKLKKILRVTGPMPRRNNMWRDRNIFFNILRGLEYVESEYAFILHDDNFILNYRNRIEYWPEYHQGSLWDGAGDYANVQSNTRSYFSGGPVRNFDVHAPHMVHKRLFQELKLDWEKEYGYCIKTIYFERYGYRGDYCSDLKFKARYSLEHVLENTLNRNFFSISDTAYSKQVLEHFYPNKSRYEAD